VPMRSLSHIRGHNWSRGFGKRCHALAVTSRHLYSPRMTEPCRDWPGSRVGQRDLLEAFFGDEDWESAFERRLHPVRPRPGC
jgi:hypothetical protein